MPPFILHTLSQQSGPVGPVDGPSGARVRCAKFSGLIRSAEGEQGYRCVQVIHGKGLNSKNREPVLKILVRGWLAQHNHVLAFCQANPAEGGSGAVLVLLKTSMSKRAK